MIERLYRCLFGKKGGSTVTYAPSALAIDPASGEDSLKFRSGKLAVSREFVSLFYCDEDPNVGPHRAMHAMVRHLQGDWGAAGEALRERNERFLGQPGRRVTSVFHTGDNTPYVVTTLFVDDEEAETYLMTPEEHRELFGEDELEEALH